MSLRATLWALDDAPIENPTEVLVLIALADEAADDGTRVFPSVRRVAARARVKPRAAQYALRKLEAAGIIRRGDQSLAAAEIKRADRRPVVYELCMSRTWETDGKQRPSDDGVQDVHPVRGASAAPRTGNGVQSDVERGAPETPHGVQPVAPDPKDNPNYNPKKSGGQAAATLDAMPQPPATTAQDADRLAKAWWARYESRHGPIIRKDTGRPYLALRTMIGNALAHYTEDEIKRALDAVDQSIPVVARFEAALGDVRKGGTGRPTERSTTAAVRNRRCATCSDFHPPGDPCTPKAPADDETRAAAAARVRETLRA